MAVSMRVKASPAACRSSSRRATVVVKAQSDNKLSLAAAAFAASALLSAPAFAGVVLQQPEAKKVFQSSGAPAAPVERPFRQPGAASSAPAVKAEAPKPKKAESSSGSDSLDPRSVALPASIAAIAGLGFAISKVDDGFTEWFTESGAMVRNSGNYAGFEEDIKGGVLATAGAGTRSTKVGSKKGGTVRK